MAHLLQQSHAPGRPATYSLAAQRDARHTAGVTGPATGTWEKRVETSALFLSGIHGPLETEMSGLEPTAAVWGGSGMCGPMGLPLSPREIRKVSGTICSAPVSSFSNKE